MGTIALKQATDGAAWDELVASYDQALSFHEWSWLDLQQEVLGIRFDRLLVESGGRPVGVFPVARPPARSVKSLPLPFPFLGPLVPDDALGETLRAWRRRQWRRGPGLARFDVGPLLAEEWRGPLLASGCELKELRTVVVDLVDTSAERLRSSYSRSHRGSLKRAVRAGTLVRPAAPGELEGLLDGLLEEAYAARGSRSPYPRGMGRQVEEWLRGRDDAVALVAEVGGEPAGTMVTLAGHPTALLWVGGCLRRFREASPNVLLFHECFLWAREQGCVRVDLCASVDAGVLRYKLGFGGEELLGLRANSFLLPGRALTAARGARDVLRWEGREPVSES